MKSTLWRRTAIGLLVVPILTGCASRGPQPIADPFTGSAKPEVQVSGSTTLPRERLENYVGKVRHLAANAKPRSSQNLSLSLEMQDPRLRAALLRVSTFPTPGHHRAVAELYRELQVLDAAYAHFAKALRLNPADAKSYEGIARIWRDWGFPHLGLGDADRAIQYAPRSPSAHNTQGTLLQAMGRRAEAKQAYRRSIELDPMASYALNNLCYAALLDREREVALTACRQALLIDPTLRPARNNLALVYAAGGDLDTARRLFAVNDDTAGVEFNLGIIHLSRKQYGSAVKAFEAAQQIKPSLTRAADRARQARGLLAERHHVEDAIDARD